MKTPDLTQLTDNTGEIAVDRTLAELRSGPPVLLTDGKMTNLVLCAEVIYSPTLETVLSLPVAGGARLGPGALWAHAQEAPLVYPPDAPAPGAYGDDVEHG